MKRSGPIKRRGRPSRTVKRKGRIVASGKDYAELVARVCFGAYCACGCGRKANTAHHIVGRGGPWMGDDVIDNLAPLAGDGTRLCHGAYTSKQRTFDPELNVYIEPADVAAGIRDYLEQHPEKRRYVVRKTSDAWLELHYPTTRRAA